MESGVKSGTEPSRKPSAKLGAAETRSNANRGFFEEA